MIRSQKVPLRPVYNQSSSSSNETNSTSTNVPDITSYIGKILTINHHQVIVEDILGQGGFAFVFLVRSYQQHRYALKRMYVNNQRDLHVCQREISLVKELSSQPNIVKYVDSFIHRLSSTNIQRRQFQTGENGNDEDDAIYEILLLTEYCSNGALINRLNEQRNVGLTLNERQILRIFADICNAVCACHFRRPQPILHRDIKLENILIDSHQSYVLCDFGSAILLPPSTTNDHQQYPTNQLTTNIIQQLEEEIQRYTTVSYRAPEMIDLYSRLPITLKTDVWAMGCLLYKLMYNTMPFGESILAIQNGTFVIPDEMAQTYRRELNLLVRYMLEIDINKRPDIWQVSYITYKLLGIECPIPNRCQSKIPDLRNVSMPLTDSESRHQRTNALSKTKSTSTNVLDESLSLGTAVNPRERPRGMMAPSTSLINFTQSSQPSAAATVVVPPPPPPLTSNPSRSGSAAQLMFDDDFSKLPSHAISLTNIPTVMSTNANEQIVSRARPSPPATISAASGFALQQQLIPLPPPPSSSNMYSHRRSSSQTMPPTNAQSSFHSASSVDKSVQDESSNDDDDNDQFSNHNYATLNSQLHSDDEQIFSPISDDDKSFSPRNQKIKRNSLTHRPSPEEAEKNISFANLINKYSVKSSTDYSYNVQDNPNVVLSNFSKQHSAETNNSGPLVHDDSDHTTQAYQTSTKPSLTDVHNPFLRAPFHHSSANKQTSSTMNVERIISAVNSSTFDADSIVFGKKTSAFTPYQKPEMKPASFVIESNNNSGPLTVKPPHSQSSVPDRSSPSTNVFTSAPFKSRSKSKQRSTTTNNGNTTSPLFTSNTNPDIEPQQHGYSNLSFDDAIVDHYF